MKKIDLGTLRVLAKEKLDILLESLENVHQAIARDVAVLHESCPCGADGKCASVPFAIPLIQNKYGLSKVKNAIEMQTKLVQDLLMREASPSYEGWIGFDDDGHADLFFLVVNATILLFQNMGKNSPITALSEMLAQKELKTIFMYSTAPKEKIETVFNVIARLTSSRVDELISQTDQRSDRQLFLLEQLASVKMSPL